MMKNHNFNKFGRYNGGVPGKVGKYRGGASGETGEIVEANEMHLIRGAGSSVDLYTSREDMRANTNFYKSDKDHYDYKHTYYQAKVEDWSNLFKTKTRYYIFLFLCVDLILGILFFDLLKSNDRKKALVKLYKKGKLEISDGFVFRK